MNRNTNQMFIGRFGYIELFQMFVERLTERSHPLPVSVIHLTVNSFCWLSAKHFCNGYVLDGDNAVAILYRQLRLDRELGRLNTRQKCRHFLQGIRHLKVFVFSVEHLGYERCWFVGMELWYRRCWNLCCLDKVVAQIPLLR